jgi:uncharacterized protein YkvS
MKLNKKAVLVQITQEMLDVGSKVLQLIKKTVLRNKIFKIIHRLSAAKHPNFVPNRTKKSN